MSRTPGRKTLEQWLTSRWSLRALSLVIALLVWFFVAWDHQVQGHRTLKLPVEVVNLPQGMVAALDDKWVEARFLGDVDSLAELERNRPRCTLDAQGLAAGRHRVPVRVPIPRGIRTVTLSPKSLHVTLERFLERSLPVRIERGEDFPQGARIQSFRVVPAEVTIRGAERDVMAVDLVRVVVRAADLKERKRTYDVDLVTRASQRKGLLPVDVAPRQVRVDLVVSADRRTVRCPLRIPVVGVPERDYHVENISLSPDQVLLEGPPSLLEGVSEVVLDPLDITGLRADLVLQLPIKPPLPEVAIIGPQQARVRISLERRVTQRTLTNIPLRVEGESPLRGWTPNPDRVSVVVEGSPSALAHLEGDPGGLEAYVDVSNVVTPRIVLPVLVRSSREDLRILRTEPPRVQLQGQQP